jgi:UDP-glucose 4-epimerase
MQMRCLVTGATGFIGSHLVEMLVKKGCQVSIIIRPNSNLWRIQEHKPSLYILKGDLSEIQTLKAQITEFQPQALIHAGWWGVNNNQRDDIGQVRNMHYSLELFDVCLASGCQVIVGLGSQAEYGQTNRILVEDMLAYPDTLYGATKLLTGFLGQKRCLDLNIPFIWLRLTAAFGPKDDPSHLIPYVISTLLRRETPALTDGKQKWDYLYIDDILAAIWDIITHPQIQGMFNLSSGQAIPVSQICEMIRDRIDPSLPLGLGKVPYPKDARTTLEASNYRLHQMTGWKPRISWEDGIEKTIKWYSQQVLP